MKPPIIPLDQPITIADWRKGRTERRRVGLLVAPATIRRAEGSSDPRLRPAFGGERAPLAGRRDRP